MCDVLFLCVYTISNVCLSICTYVSVEVIYVEQDTSSLYNDSASGNAFIKTSGLYLDGGKCVDFELCGIPRLARLAFSKCKFIHHTDTYRQFAYTHARVLHRMHNELRGISLCLSNPAGDFHVSFLLMCLVECLEPLPRQIRRRLVAAYL
jgi:hypothetical protein